ncbi:DNA polymerase III subunit beta [soil metagenome]
MKIHLPQKDLEAATTVVSSLVDRSAGPLPVLANVLIDATESGVQFRGTDVESLVSVNLNATVSEPGRTTVPADTFRDIVKLLPPQAEVTIEEKGRRVTVTCETNEYKLMTIPAEDFPDYAAEPGQSRFLISQKTLRQLIDATAYALPTKDHRRVLLGVYFELTTNMLRLTATDGKKLARVSANVPEIEGGGSAAIVVPRKLLDNLYRTLGSEGPVEIEMSSRQISFRFGNILYRCNGIEGKYPDCDSVIPKDFPIEIGLNRDVFLQASKRAGITTDEKNKSIILKFDDNRCAFASMAHDLGAFSGKISLDYNGPAIELAFNYLFLNETLSHFNSSEIRMYVKNSTAPVVFRTKDEESRLALLMPIKLADVRAGGAPDEADGGDEEEEEEE